MKIVNATVCMFLASLIIAGPASAATLVGHWTLDETSGNAALDSVGGNHGAWQNGVSNNLARPGGVIGVSADLMDAGGNAADNYFQINNINQFIGADGLTLSAWVDPDAQANSGYNGIVMTRDFNGATNNSWGIAIEADHLDSRVDGPGIDSAAGSLSPNNGWHHVVLTYDANTKTHTQYINGIQTNTADVSGDGGLGATLNGPSGPWFIGFDNCCGDSRDFDGRIDDVSAWTGALTATEVSKLYSAGLQKVGADGALAFVAPTATSLQDNLVGHWSMDQVAGTQDAGDSIGRSHATLTNMDPNTDWVAGQIGNALQFDGVNDQAIISGQRADDLNATLNGVTALTMSVWVNSAGGNENSEGIFEHRDGAGNPLTGFNTPGGANANDIQFRINTNGITSGADALVTGEWSLLTGVWESGVRQELYVNGELVAFDATPLGGTLTAVGDWRFGNDICCGGRFFNGGIDDAGIWTRALTAAEIARLYADGLDGLNLAQAGAVPEPTTALALSLGSLLLLRRRRSAA